MATQSDQVLPDLTPISPPSAMDDNNKPSTRLPPPPVSVRPTTPSLLPSILSLSVSPSQSPFVDSPALILADIAASSPLSSAHAILLGPPGNEVVVGFYRLDRARRAVAGRDFGPASVGLRAFFVDARWQGRGVAGAAMEAMGQALRAEGVARVVLSVNVRNEGARRVYERAGFRAEEELYTGGKAGPQWVMVREL